MSLLAPVSAYPLGVGELTLNSALNESLNAEISLALSANEDINDISVSIASPEKFAEAGISWHYYLSGIRFNKVSKGNNKYIVELTSNNIVQEPFLDFLLEVKWPNGNVFKSFTVLVDPAPESQSDFMEPVQGLVNKPKKSVTTARVVEREVEPDLSSLAVEGEYGPTKRNDSLWKIAEKINHNQDQSVEQVMMALYKANPRAFYKKNVNALMAGKTLKIPSNSDINQLSKQQAHTEFYLQHDIWTGKRKARPNSRVVAPSVKKKAKQLTLVSPVKDELKAEDGLVADTEQKQTLINQNEALQARLALLEEKFSVMQKMLTIKDKELAALQDARFSEELDAIEEKSKEVVKEKIAPIKEIAKPEPAAKETLVTPPKVVVEDKKTQVASDVIEEGTSYINIMLGLLFVLLAAIAGIFSWRRRQTDDETEVENIFKTAEQFSGADDLAPIKTDKEEGTIVDRSAASAAVVEPSKIKEEVMDDVLLDADTFLAYGKYDEAEKALRDEISQFPNKDSYKLKLLEVFYSSEDNDAFDAFVQELVKDGKRSDSVFWENVSAMGQDFSTNSELFSSDVIRDESPEFDLSIDESFASPVDKSSEVAEEPIMELDLSDEEATEEKAFSEPEKLDIESFEFTPSQDGNALDADPSLEENNFSVEEGVHSDALEMIDFSLDKKSEEISKDIGEPEPEELEVIDMDLSLTAEESHVDTISSEDDPDLLLEDSEADINLAEFSLPEEPKLADELSLDEEVIAQDLGQEVIEESDTEFDDFDFDFSVEGDASYTAPEEDSEVGSELSLEDDEQKLSIDPSIISDINDTGDYETNLDLAKMYVAMGENDAAKELAEDIFANGSDEQKKEAKEILDHIAS